MTLPNILTLIRIVLIPLMVVVFFLPVSWHYLGAAFIFALSGWTDWLDGYIARYFNMSSKLGAFLDPVADKLLVCVSMLLIVYSHHTIWVAVPALIIIGREIFISALREWMSEMQARANVKVSYIGKVKTTAQMFAMLFLMAYPFDLSIKMVWFGYALLYFSTVLTLWSMIDYMRAAWPHLLSE